MSGFELITITFFFVLGLGVAQILSSVAYVVRDKEAKYGQAQRAAMACVDLSPVCRRNMAKHVG